MSLEEARKKKLQIEWNTDPKPGEIRFTSKREIGEAKLLFVCSSILSSVTVLSECFLILR